MSVPALKGLRKLLRQLDTPVAFADFPREVRREKSDRAVIVMCTSFIDVSLKAALASRMKNKDAGLALFDDTGPLHSFNAKIRLAEAMGLFGPETRKNLEIIQTVRNAFAHSLAVKSFETPEVEQACNALTLPPKEIYFAYTNQDISLIFGTAKQKISSITMLITVATIFAGTPVMEDDDGNVTAAPLLP